MLGLRLTSEVQKRWKNGRPHHRTTGVASKSSSHGKIVLHGVTTIRSPGIMLSPPMKKCGQSMLPIAIARSGTVSTRPIQNRRVISRSSGFSSCVAVTVRGSRAMPQRGHKPGSVRTIWGCMGQVYSVRVEAMGISGSRAMPQVGQAPGLDSRTSGHMGHT